MLFIELLFYFLLLEQKQVTLMGTSSASNAETTINTSTESASTLATNVTETDTSETCDSLDLGEILYLLLILCANQMFADGVMNLNEIISEYLTLSIYLTGDSSGQVEPLLSSFDEPPLTAVPINPMLRNHNEDERRILLEEEDDEDEDTQNAEDEADAKIPLLMSPEVSFAILDFCPRNTGEHKVNNSED